MLPRHYLIFYISTLFFVPNIFCQNDSSFYISKNPLFQSDSLFFLNLYFDIKSVFKDNGNSPVYHQLTITYINNWGLLEKINAEIKTRGIFRKNSGTCNFPPLILKFSEKDSKSTIFEGIDRIKLTTHCQNTLVKYQNNLLKEYLIYKIYNLLTPFSYQVKLLKVNYIDIVKLDTISKFSFFIEPDKLLSKRLSGTIITKKNIHPNATNLYFSTFMSIFQFMIGNTDWSIKALHNIKLLETFEASPAITIPYDFDFSGLVNAPYAQPAEHLPIKSVRERYFNGYCRTSAQYNMVLEKFKLSKNSIYQLVKDFPYLAEKEKHEILNYFDQFYRIIESPKKIEREFVKKCRTD